MTSRKNVEIPSIGDSKKAVFDPTGGYCKRGLVAHRRATPRFSGMVIDPFWVCLKTGHTVPPNGKFNLARNANLINRVVFIVVFFVFRNFRLTNLGWVVAYLWQSVYPHMRNWG